MRFVCHSPQERGSSEASGQSAPPSQYQWAGMQRPLEQRNSLWEHVDAAAWKKGVKSTLGLGVCVCVCGCVRLNMLARGGQTKH